MATRRTNRGQSLDLDTLFNSGKNTPAVGNMKVNANGDVIDGKGRIVQKKEDRVREYYRDNPKSSTSGVSLRGEQQKVQADAIEKPTVTKEQVAAKQQQIKEELIQPDEFDAPAEQQPLGYKEVHLPSGDIEMVPFYREDD